MAFPQTKTPLPLTVRKRQRRINSSAVPLLLPVQSPAPQCASNNARPVITGACRSRLLGRKHRPFSRKARRGSSHGRPALPCTSRQLSAAFFPGTLSRHSRIFHCHGVYSPGGLKSRDMTRLFFHLVHIMNESSSCDDCPGQLCRAWILYKKSEVTASRVPIKQYLQKFPQWGKIWRDFGHAFSFASSSSRGMYPSPSYLIWMCCTRFPLDLSGAST